MGPTRVKHHRGLKIGRLFTDGTRWHYEGSEYHNNEEELKSLEPVIGSNTLDSPKESIDAKSIDSTKKKDPPVEEVSEQISENIVVPEEVLSQKAKKKEKKL